MPSLPPYIHHYVLNTGQSAPLRRPKEGLTGLGTLRDLLHTGHGVLRRMPHVSVQIRAEDGVGIFSLHHHHMVMDNAVPLSTTVVALDDRAHALVWDDLEAHYFDATDSLVQELTDASGYLEEAVAPVQTPYMATVLELGFFLLGSDTCEYLQKISRALAWGILLSSTNDATLKGS